MTTERKPARWFSGVTAFEVAKINNLLSTPKITTMGGNLTLTHADRSLQSLDPAGDRDVTLPKEGESTGKVFFIINRANADEALTVKEDAGVTTIGIVGQNQTGVFFCDGTTWQALIGWTGSSELTSTIVELNLLDNQVASATMVVGSESGNVINVTIQLKDAAGSDMATPSMVAFYQANDAAGLNPTTVAQDGAVAIGTDGAMIASVAKLSGFLISENDGDIDINLTDAGAFTTYLVLVMPNGTLSISAAITHAA